MRFKTFSKHSYRARTQTKTSTSTLGRRRKKMFKLKACGVIIFVIALVLLFLWLIRFPEILIQDISISGNTITSSEEIENIAHQYLEGSYVFIVPKNSSFLYPRRKIERSILHAFTRIREVSVKKSDSITMHIQVREREPFAMWCDDALFQSNASTTTNAPCYFIDEESYIYATAPHFTGNVFFTYYGDIAIDSIYADIAPLGAQYMNTEDFFDIQPFLVAFSDLDYIPVSLRRIDELDLEMELGDGARIIFSHDTRLPVLLDNMQSVLDSDVFIEAEENEKQIDYIDLRFGNKVYVKFVGEEE